MATKLRPYSENELLEKLKQYCPDFKVGLNDIRNPTQDFVKEMYRRILIEFNVDISSLVQPHFHQMDLTMPYGEMYQDIIPLGNLLKAVDSFGVIRDFGISDIVNPVPKRNLQQMSAFIQFVEYCDMKLGGDLNDKLEIVRNRKARQRELLQNIDDLRERKNTRALQRTKMIDEKSELEKIYQTLIQEQKAVLNEKDAVIEEREKIKAVMNEMARCIEKLEKDMGEVEEEIERVKSRIVVSPTSIVTDMDTLRKKREEYNEELENVKDKLQSKKQLNAQLNEEVSKQEETMLYLTELIELIHSTQAKKKTLDNMIKALNEKTGNAEEDKLTVKKFQMKAEALREELSHLNSQFKADVTALTENIESVKRECEELKLKNFEVEQFAAKMKDIKSIIQKKIQELNAYQEDNERLYKATIAEEVIRNEDWKKALEQIDTEFNLMYKRDIIL